LYNTAGAIAASAGRSRKVAIRAFGKRRTTGGRQLPQFRELVFLGQIAHLL
jgi:hypothetical protein